MQIKTRIENKKVVDSAVRGFGYKDKKGRRIGAAWCIGTADSVPVPDASWGYGILPVGQYFTFWAQSTRDDATYGASQRTHYFSTMTEAVNARDAYLAAARIRAAKVGA